MKLLEYEAKALLDKYSIPIPKGTVIKRGTRMSLGLPVVLKSQVPTGGRGKLGGIVVAKSPKEFTLKTKDLFNLKIKEFLPQVLLAEEELPIQSEHYISIRIDRSTSAIRILAHKRGGIEVEHNTSDFLDVELEEDTFGQLVKKVSTHLGYSKKSDVDQLQHLLANLFVAFTKNDAILIEINPLIYTKEGTFIVADAKIELDDAAMFRHPEWKFEDTLRDANFVTLNPNGTVATIANGAGLAMATVDAVEASNLAPANFLDIGGGATAENILMAFRRIAEFPDVTAIIINIFAGITKCDEVAKAIIQAKKQIKSLPSLYIRLAGNNFEIAARLLSEENITTLSTLDKCIATIKEARE